MQDRVRFRSTEGYKEGNVVKDFGNNTIHVEDDNGIVWATKWHLVTLIDEE